MTAFHPPILVGAVLVLRRSSDLPASRGVAGLLVPVGSRVPAMSARDEQRTRTSPESMLDIGFAPQADPWEPGLHLEYMSAGATSGLIRSATPSAMAFNFSVPSFERFPKQTTIRNVSIVATASACVDGPQ